MKFLVAMDPTVLLCAAKIVNALTYYVIMAYHME